MGIIISSKHQDMLVGGPKATNVKGNQNNQKTKLDAPKPKEKPQHIDDSLGSIKNKHKGKEGKNKGQIFLLRKGVST